MMDDYCMDVPEYMHKEFYEPLIFIIFPVVLLLGYVFTKLIRNTYMTDALKEGDPLEIWKCSVDEMTSIVQEDKGSEEVTDKIIICILVVILSSLQQVFLPYYHNGGSLETSNLMYAALCERVFDRGVFGPVIRDSAEAAWSFMISMFKWPNFSVSWEVQYAFGFALVGLEKLSSYYISFFLGDDPDGEVEKEKRRSLQIKNRSTSDAERRIAKKESDKAMKQARKKANFKKELALMSFFWWMELFLVIGSLISYALNNASGEKLDFHACLLVRWNAIILYKPLNVPLFSILFKWSFADDMEADVDKKLPKVGASLFRAQRNLTLLGLLLWGISAIPTLPLILLFLPANIAVVFLCLAIPALLFLVASVVFAVAFVCINWPMLQFCPKYQSIKHGNQI
jgi:hypothetical protein